MPVSMHLVWDRYRSDHAPDVTGMREDLKMFGNEYTYCLSESQIRPSPPYANVTVMYTIAFAIMQIPANMFALKFRPRLLIFICEMGWTAFT